MEALSNSPIQVYIVEDYHLTRLGLISALKENPNLQFIGEAESAEEALEEIETLPGVDVLLLDLGLPGMNGIEMAHIVRQRWPDIKIVVLTSHNQQEEILAALGAGAQAYALKDIKPHRLAQVIEMVHEGAGWLDPSIASTVLTMLSGSGMSPSKSSYVSNFSSESADLFSKKGGSNPGTGADRPSIHADLTERERDVLKLIVQGKNNQDISESLHISIHTTKAHVGSILSKLSVNDRVQAAVKALKENIV